ncbi:efflux RND transporter periplasmic adaptor subunit [Aquimarina sp. RZ0]|uniref:efflux RND transporter periplasmic adaptor subunit n=1 Tax=Aquimarina sp. RZ0 TaxID=2607730 RepID=UPI0011F323FC|nr:efflux RND transporter periplasmic adaptor subunit [Aquimarina sp. RZ0]KAA1242401.1 efflux RND transporter periplasmic adaptor subunit [Aquimarina sp. RZ0]
MKKVLYISIAVLVGFLTGYLIFGKTSEGEIPVNHDHTAGMASQIWTCSMHPQIIQSDPGDCPICGMDLTPTRAPSEELSTHQFKMSENALALADIQTSVVGNTDMGSRNLKLSGKIKENEDKQSVQVTHFAGRIETLFTKSIGENIAKGQVLAMIYSPELMTAQQELVTSISLKKTQPELYKAVRNKLRIRKLSEEQILQIESSGEIKEVFPIHSHVSGIITEKMVEEGDHVHKGQTLYKVSDLNTVWASFDVYEHQIPFIREGQEIKITTNAYANKTFTATISFIDPVLNTKTRTVSVRTILNNKDQIFKPGMFIEGVVSGLAEKSTGITIPKSAVLWTGKRSVVYIKTSTDKPIFEMREVTLGVSNSTTYTIVDGLKNGDEIVTHGTFTVDAAAQLQGKKSMMNRVMSIDTSTQKE